MLKGLSDIRGIPFRGGCVTEREKALLPFGGYSLIQNIRNRHPGFEKRKGCIKLHSEADGSNEVTTMYQFNKNYVSETHFYAQMGDGDVLEATNDPPTVTTGVFGTEVFNGSASQIPASWNDINDLLLHSNGVNQHQIYGGNSSYVKAFIVHTGEVAEDDLSLPTYGKDFSTEVANVDTSKIATLTGLSDSADDDCIYILCPIKADGIGFTFEAYNDTSSTLKVDYWNGAWTNLTITDGTASAGDTFAQDGDVTWTTQSDEITRYLYGQVGFWYKVYLQAGTKACGAETIDEDCDDFAAGWSDDDGGDGESTQATYDTKETFKFDSVSTTAANYAERSLDVGAIGNTCIVEMQVYCDKIGVAGVPTDQTGDAFRIFVDHADCRLAVSFSTDGLLIWKNATEYTEVGTDIVVQDEWQTWIFDINFTTPANAKVDVYLNNVVQAYNVDCSYTGTYTDGDVTLTQNGENAANNITYLSYLKIGTTLAGNASLDSCTVNTVTFDSDWQKIVNQWDGIPVSAIEVQVETGLASGKFNTFASETVNLSSLAVGAKVMLATTDPIEGIYWDVGSVANTNSTTLSAIKHWNGTAFTDVGTEIDATSGLNNTGWMIFPRNTAYPRQFGGSSFYMYWYEVTFATAAFIADVIASIQVMPYFDVDELGNGRVNCVWKDRAVYSFDEYPNYLYVAPANKPTTLNGSDFGVLIAGSGRTNKVAAAVLFYNEMMVFQKEKGAEGGSITLFEGYSPLTFGSLVISSKLGTFSAKTVAVVDGVLTSTASNEAIKTLVFFISQYGICATDGRTVSIVSDDIRNYFDPQETECIRDGYEEKMFLFHDTTENVLRIGLVSGSTATKCNVFPVFDLVDKTWSFDTPAQEFSSMAEVSAQSGNVTAIQVGGGVDDGFIYQLNTGLNDVDTAIDSYAILEFDALGEYLCLDEFTLRCVSQSAGSVTLTFYDNENSWGTKSLLMTAARASEGFRRHRESLGLDSEHPAIKIRHNTASQSMYLLDFGLSVNIWDGR